MGYDAYSILKTGRDHHGNWFPVVAFESFAGLEARHVHLCHSAEYFYLWPQYLCSPLPFCGCWGSHRHRLWRTQSYFICYPPKKQQFAQSSIAGYQFYYACLCSWTVGSTILRVGWESNLATAFTLWAMILMLLALMIHANNFSNHIYAGSATLMALAMYTYHAARLGTPVMLLAVGFYAHWPMLRNFQWNKKTQSWLKHLIIPIFLLAILLAPLVINLTSNEVTNRFFHHIYFFSDLSVIETSNQLKSLVGNSVLSRLLYHRYWLFSKVIFQQIVVNLDLNYLFLHGDSNLRHSIQFFGQLFPLSFPLVLIGLATMAYHFRKQSVLLLHCYLYWEHCWGL